jgi:hypothetical protein
MYDGKFYDASAYKASPVPMALQSGTVYEAVKTGISQGLFTIKEPAQTQGVWTAEGIWEAAGSAPKSKKPLPPPPKEDDLDKPPVLRHADSEPGRPTQAAPRSPAPQQPPASSTSAPDTPALAAPAQEPDAEQENDQDRPVLRRGKAAAHEEELKQKRSTTPTTSPNSSPQQAIKNSSGTIQIIPAISDTAGPEPRPYAYIMKPEEEQAFRKKILLLAAQEIRARTRQLAAETTGSATFSPAPRRPAGTKSLPPIFENVQLRVFDLSNANEPVLVLTADAHMPPPPNVANRDTQCFITLVARQDTYGELKKAFTNITDNLHLDAIPRLELIDAVDADGDGRGELLFRKISDAGRAFNLYRVIGDQLYPLFEGTAQ